METIRITTRDGYPYVPEGTTLKSTQGETFKVLSFEEGVMAMRNQETNAYTMTRAIDLGERLTIVQPKPGEPIPQPARKPAKENGVKLVEPTLEKEAGGQLTLAF